MKIWWKEIVFKENLKWKDKLNIANLQERQQKWEMTDTDAWFEVFVLLVQSIEWVENIREFILNLDGEDFDNFIQEAEKKIQEIEKNNKKKLKNPSTTTK